MKVEKDYYTAAGVRYPAEDLFGYPDTLIRARMDSAYKESCKVLDNQPQSVLDIGSCHGHGIKTIRDELAPEFLVSSDRWIDFLQAQRKVIITNTDRSSVDFVTLNATATFLPFRDKVFDAVFLMHVIEHLDEPKNLLMEMRRITKADGYLVIATPNRPNLIGKNSADRFVYTATELRELLEMTGMNPEIYYLVPDESAWSMHARKNWLAHHLPFTGYLRKKVPWKLWDRIVLGGSLDSTSFSMSPIVHSRTIDLIVVAAIK